MLMAFLHCAFARWILQTDQTLSPGFSADAARVKIAITSRPAIAQTSLHHLDIENKPLVGRLINKVTRIEATAAIAALEKLDV